MPTRHSSNINRVIDFIQENLEDELSLSKLAERAHLSDFHFSRVFKSLIGEPVHSYIRRLRLEKSAGLLISTPSIAITEIALESGFANSSSFAKAFKSHFGVSAKEWRTNNRQNSSHQRPQARLTLKAGKALWSFDKPFNDFNSQPIVKLENLEAETIVYIRHVGPFFNAENLFTELYDRLYNWAIPRGLVDDKTRAMNLYHDMPSITETGKLRVMAALTMGDLSAEDLKDTKGINISTSPEGQFGVGQFLLKSADFAPAWSWMFHNWLPQTGFVLDDRPCLERIINVTQEDGLTLYNVELCLPVTAA